MLSGGADSLIRAQPRAQVLSAYAGDTSGSLCSETRYDRTDGLVQVFSLYPVLKIHHTSARHTSMITKVIAALMPTLTSETP